MEMKVKKTQIASFLGFISTIIAIIVIALIIIPTENRDTGFWFRVLWTIYLSFLIWGFISGFLYSVLFSGNDIEDIGGVLPFLGVSLFFYTFLSFSIMIIQAIFSSSELLSKLHFISQILLTLGIIIIGIGLYYTHKGAKITTKNPKNIYSPAKLVSIIRNEEERFSLTLTSGVQSKEIKNIASGLKDLREKIKYSLPQAGKIFKSDEYIMFADDIQNMCMILSKTEPTDEKSIDNLKKVQKQIIILISRVNVISGFLKKI